MDAAISYLAQLWRNAKTWHSLRLGPVTFHLRLARSHRRVARHLHGSHELSRALPIAASETAVVVGMGEEIGPAVTRKLASEGLQVAAVSRSPLICDTHARVRSYPCDVTDEVATKRAFASIARDLGAPALVVYGVQGSNPGNCVDIEVAAFEEAWRANCLGAFIVAREAARAMRVRGGGTIVFLGSTSGTIGRAGHLSLAVGKFGLRALAQVMARELHAEGIHVVHLIIDADVRKHCEDGAPHSDPADLSEIIWSLHRQRRSTWTHELDVRPHSETFWEHC